MSEKGAKKGTTTKQKRIVDKEVNKREKPAHAKIDTIEKNVHDIEKKFNRRMW